MSAISASESVSPPLPEKIALLVHEARWLLVGLAGLYLALILWGFERGDPGWSHAAVVERIANPGGRFSASRSRSDYDPAIHNNPRWNTNILNGEPSANEVPDCLADIGRVGAVAEPDGMTDNNDFIVFINHNVIDRARHVFSPHLLNRVGSIKIVNFDDRFTGGAADAK